MRISDWSSDVCSSDLSISPEPLLEAVGPLSLQVKSRDIRAAALTAKCPACAALTHNARHILADMLFHRRAPGTQREIARPFAERMASACHFDGSYQLSVHRFAVLGFNTLLPHMIRMLAGDAHHLALMVGCAHPHLI